MYSEEEGLAGGCGTRGWEIDVEDGHVKSDGDSGQKEKDRGLTDLLNTI